MLRDPARWERYRENALAHIMAYSWKARRASIEEERKTDRETGCYAAPGGACCVSGLMLLF